MKAILIFEDAEDEHINMSIENVLSDTPTPAQSLAQTMFLTMKTILFSNRLKISKKEAKELCELM